MDELSRDELGFLKDHRGKACVSMYLPMQRAGRETEQNPIQLKNALRQVQEQLGARGWRQPDVDALLRPLAEMLGQDPFWRNQEDGLAIFLAPGLLRTYRLPRAFSPQVLVADRFHLKPLLPLLGAEKRFYVLAISQNEVRLLRGDRYSVEPVRLEHVPESLAEALRYSEQAESVWRQSALATPSTGPTTRTATFHGHGQSPDDAQHKKDILQFFLQLDRGLHEVLREERSPLVLAGVEFLVALFRDVCSYRHVAEKSLRGNPELLRPEELHRQAWAVVEPELRSELDAALARYRELAGTGRAVNGLREILTAAAEGRVDTLFVALDAVKWGKVDEQSGEVHECEEQEAGCLDLLDVAATRTLSLGGTVHALPMQQIPAGAHAAAIMRY